MYKRMLALSNGGVYYYLVTKNQILPPFSRYYFNEDEDRQMAVLRGVPLDKYQMSNVVKIRLLNDFVKRYTQGKGDDRVYLYFALDDCKTNNFVVCQDENGNDKCYVGDIDMVRFNITMPGKITSAFGPTKRVVIHKKSKAARSIIHSCFGLLCTYFQLLYEMPLFRSMVQYNDFLKDLGKLGHSHEESKTRESLREKLCDKTVDALERIVDDPLGNPSTQSCLEICMDLLGDLDDLIRQYASTVPQQFRFSFVDLSIH